MSTLRYRVIAPKGIFVGEDFYDINAIVTLTEAGAKYLLMAKKIALASEQAPVGEAPGPSEDDVYVDVSVGARVLTISLTKLRTLFPNIVGPQGEVGPAGPKGDKGDKGNKGDAGRGIHIVGAVAVAANLPIEGEIGDVYVTLDDSHGHAWTEDGWIDIGSFRGPQGAQGIRGLTGLKGDIGDQGPQGEQGIQGIQGILGPKGDKGDTGIQGIQGIQGLKGDQGDIGPKGDQGIQGPLGPQGLKGDKGDKGDKGEIGPQGAQGVQGASGDAATITVTPVGGISSTNLQAALAELDSEKAADASLATVAKTGAYADLSGKPTLFSGSYADLSGKPTLFSGSYTDLSNKPTLFSGSYTDLSGKPTLGSAAAKNLATTANIRANSGTDPITTDQAWAAAGVVNLGNITGAVNIDCNAGSRFVATLIGAVTISFINQKDGQAVDLAFIQDPTGGRTVSWNSNIRFPNATAPSVATAANGWAVVFSGYWIANNAQWQGAGWKVS